MLGLRPDVADARDFVKRAVVGEPPTTFSLAAFVPDLEPYQQGRTNACTGYAGAMFIRLLYGQRYNRNRGTWQASPRFLYYNARQLGGGAAVDQGAQLRDLLKGMHKCGVAPLDFHDESRGILEPPDATAVRMAHLLTIRKYERVFVNEHTPEAMMRLLALERLPILIGAEMPANVGSSPTREDGVIQMPVEGGLTLGAHALAVDGYDQRDRCFTGWNSWGTGWGQRGRFRMSFDWFTRKDLVYDIWTCSPAYW